MAVNDVCTLRVVGRYQDQNIVNTLHYEIMDQDSSDQEILSSLCSGWEAAHETEWLARHIDTYELIGLKAFRKTGDAKTPHYHPIGEAGSVVGEEIPSPVCRTITLYTGDAKHRRRGRVMLSGTAVAHLSTTDGSVVAAELVLLNLLGDSLRSALESGLDSWRLCIPATEVDDSQAIVDVKARVTPSIVKSRRIRNFLIG